MNIHILKKHTMTSWFVQTRRHIVFYLELSYDGIGNGYTTSDKNRDWKLNLKKRISDREGCPLLVIHQSDLPNLENMIKEQIFTTYWKNTLRQQEISVGS